MGRSRRKTKTCSVVPSASESKPPTAAASPLVCKMCYCHYSQRSFGFFLPDLAMPLLPRFRLDGLSRVQYCIANSILYLFELCDYTCAVRKSVYSLDLSAVLSAVLSESPTEMVVVEKAMLDKCSEMRSSKPAVAHAILTPKGKILIYSPFTGVDGFDFELFDPDTKQCRALPQLPSTRRMFIQRCEFLSDCMFMISTNCSEFVLDLDRSVNNGCGWVKYIRVPHPPSPHEFIAFGSFNYSFSVSGFGFYPPLSIISDSHRNSDRTE